MRTNTYSDRLKPVRIGAEMRSRSVAKHALAGAEMDVRPSESQARSAWDAKPALGWRGVGR